MTQHSADGLRMHTMETGVVAFAGFLFWNPYYVSVDSVLVVEPLLCYFSSFISHLRQPSASTATTGKYA